MQRKELKMKEKKNNLCKLILAAVVITALALPGMALASS
jgi:hypothetical protein